MCLRVLPLPVILQVPALGSNNVHFEYFERQFNIRDPDEAGTETRFLSSKQAKNSLSIYRKGFQ